MAHYDYAKYDYTIFKLFAYDPGTEPEVNSSYKLKFRAVTILLIHHENKSDLVICSMHPMTTRMELVMAWIDRNYCNIVDEFSFDADPKFLDYNNHLVQYYDDFRKDDTKRLTAFMSTFF